MRSVYLFVRYALAKMRFLLKPTEPDLCDAKAVGDKSGHYFFGYYNSCPWNNDGRYMLCLKAAFANRMPKPGESVELYVVDLSEGRTDRIAKPKAWCWQQGSMLRWLAGSNGPLIIYNDFLSQKYVTVIRHIDGSLYNILPRPLYTISKDGENGLTLDFGRLEYASPGYGYSAEPYLNKNESHPADDGIWRMKTKTGECNLIITLEQIVNTSPIKEFEYPLI